MGKELPDSDFNTLWKSAADISLKYGFDFSLVNGLKDDDPFLDQQFKDIIICIQCRWILLLQILCYSAKQHILLIWGFSKSVSTFITQKMKFSIQDFLSKWDKSCRKLWNLSHLLKKSLGNLFLLQWLLLYCSKFHKSETSVHFSLQFLSPQSASFRRKGPPKMKVKAKPWSCS